jgi:hypothetical protein
MSGNVSPGASIGYDPVRGPRNASNVLPSLIAGSASQGGALSGVNSALSAMWMQFALDFVGFQGPMIGAMSAEDGAFVQDVP